MSGHYATTKGRIAQAIFILALALSILLVATFFYIVVATIAFGDMNGDVLAGILVTLAAIPIPAIVGWGIRWLITGRSDRNIF